MHINGLGGVICGIGHQVRGKYRGQDQVKCIRVHINTKNTLRPMDDHTDVWILVSIDAFFRSLGNYLLETA